MLATPIALKSLHDREKRKTVASEFPLRAGQAAPGETGSVLDLSQGSLGIRRSRPTGPVLSANYIFGRKIKEKS